MGGTDPASHGEGERNMRNKRNRERELVTHRQTVARWPDCVQGGGRSKGVCVGRGGGVLKHSCLCRANC